MVHNMPPILRQQNLQLRSLKLLLNNHRPKNLAQMSLPEGDDGHASLWVMPTYTRMDLLMQLTYSNPVLHLHQPSLRIEKIQQRGHQRPLHGLSRALMAVICSRSTT
jgi:hypothetical protein